MKSKGVNSEVLSTNSNYAVTWVHALPDGRLFTLASMDKNYRPENTLPYEQFLFGRISNDGGKTWGAPYHLYTWPERIPSMVYAGSLIDSKGRLHVFAMRIKEYGWHDNVYKGGISYVRLDSYEGGNPVYSSIPCLDRYTGSLNNCIETSNGRLVIPFSTLAGIQDSKFVSSVIYSDVYGLNWSVSNDITVVSDEKSIESGAVEPIVIELEQNRLLMLIRTVLGTFWYSMSYDDGKTWMQAKPTKIVSSNAPGSFIRMPNGKIFLAWNNVMGHPMCGVRYSFARQCLHGAVSDDNLRTLKGARILLKKRIGDTNILHNAYPYTENVGNNEILLRTIEVEGKGGSRWGMEQSYLTKVSPSFLEETEVHDNWNEWVCDVPAADDGVELRPTAENVAYAITSFPYATSGEITVVTEGELDGEAKILLSNCYLDRLNFMPNSRANTWDDQIPVLYDAMVVSEPGVWKMVWKEGTIALEVNGKAVQTVPMASSQGLNHFGILFNGSGFLKIKHFDAKANDNRWNTGIEMGGGL